MQDRLIIFLMYSNYYNRTLFNICILARVLRFHDLISQYLTMGEYNLFSECFCQSYLTIGSEDKELSPLQIFLRRKAKECKNCPLGNISKIVCVNHKSCDNVCANYIVNFKNHWNTNSWSHNQRTQTIVKCPVSITCKQVRKLSIFSLVF